MERLSEIKQIEAVEPQTKRDRNNVSEATQLRGEKYENDREIRCINFTRSTANTCSYDVFRKTY